MLFWLFVIIGVVAFASALIIVALAPNEDELKEARDQALRKWDVALKVRNSSASVQG